MGELADLLRSELSGPAPEGFTSSRAAAVQSVHLDALIQQLKGQFPAAEVSAAIAQLVSERVSGWNYLKLVDLSESFPSPEVAEALFLRALNPPDDVADERRLFLSGRTYEVLRTSQPLSDERRAEIERYSGPALGHLRRLREVASVRMSNRKPTGKEWALAFALLAAALAGMAYAWSTLP